MSPSDQSPKVHYTELPDHRPESPIYREWQTYKRELPRLLAEGGEGKFALIGGDEVIGVFEDEEQARRHRREQYLARPFIVQPIREWEPLLRPIWYLLPCLT